MPTVISPIVRFNFGKIEGGVHNFELQISGGSDPGLRRRRDKNEVINDPLGQPTIPEPGRQ